MVQFLRGALDDQDHVGCCTRADRSCVVNRVIAERSGDNMSDAPKRYWLRFDLLTLFCVVTALCFLCRLDSYVPAIWVLMAFTLLFAIGWRFYKRKGLPQSGQWFRFNLSILFLRITVIAMLLGSIAWRLDNLRRVDAILHSLFERQAVRAIGSSRGWFGQELTFLWLEDGLFSDDEVRQIESLSPGVKIEHEPGNGPAFK